MPTKFTPEIITAAIAGFETQKRRIDDQIAELRAMLPGGSAESTDAPESPVRKRGKFSAAAIQRMREAQQRRWAKARGEPQSSTPAPVQAPMPKRKLTAAAKAKLVANPPKLQRPKQQRRRRPRTGRKPL